MSPRRLLAAVVAAVLLTLLSTAVKGSVTEYQGWDCAPGERTCPHPVAARGFPVPFVVDKESLSPTPNVDLAGALLGLDSFRVERYTLDLAFWFAAVVGVRALLRRTRRR